MEIEPKKNPVVSFVAKLKSTLAKFPDYIFAPKPEGATQKMIESIEKIVGVKFDETLKSLWKFSNWLQIVLRGLAFIRMKIQLANS